MMNKVNKNNLSSIVICSCACTHTDVSHVHSQIPNWEEYYTFSETPQIVSYVRSHSVVSVLSPLLPCSVTASPPYWSQIVWELLNHWAWYSAQTEETHWPSSEAGPLKNSGSMWQLSVVPATVMLGRGCCNIPATVCIILDSNSHMYPILKSVVTDLVHKFLTYWETEWQITFDKLVLWTQQYPNCIFYYFY